MRWLKKKWVTNVLMLALLAVFIIYITPLRRCCFFCCLLGGSSAIEICVLSLTALIALLVYRSSCDVEEAKLLLQIREILSSPRNQSIYDKSHELYKKLKQNEKDSPTPKEDDLKLMGFPAGKVYNYMGILESCETLLDNDVISEDNFRSQFGYRIECLVGNPEIVKNELSDDPSNWAVFFSLLNRFPRLKRVYNKTKNQ